MADQTEPRSQNQESTVNIISTGLSSLLGSSYSAETLLRDANKQDQYERLSVRIATVEARRQHNIEAIARAAYVAAAEIPPGPRDHDIDRDWLARFIRWAEDVENPDMQQVWGHVLASETETPGRVSLQVLDTLSGMTAADLDLLEKVGRVFFPTGYLLKLGARNEFNEFGIGEKDIHRLQGLNLLQASDDLSVTFYAPTKGITFDFKGCDLIVRHPTSQLFILPAFRMTGTGRSVIQLLADVPADIAYLTALGQILKDQGYDYRVRDGLGALIEFV